MVCPSLPVLAFGLYGGKGTKMIKLLPFGALVATVSLALGLAIGAAVTIPLSHDSAIAAGWCLEAPAARPKTAFREMQ